MEPDKDTGKSRRRWLGPLAAIVLLMLLPFVLFWPIWWPNAEHRQVLAYGDFVEQYYPMRVFVSRELGQGRLPLWDRFTYGGEPAAAASLSAAFYPLGLWEAAFPSPLPFTALEIEAILHLGLAGVFTFLLVRQLTGRIEAGLLSGLAFGLGGFLTSYPVLQLAVLETAIWLPAGLWLMELALARHSWPWLILAGLAFGCGLLAGHPQTFMYVAYAATAFFLLRARHHGWRWRSIPFAALMLAGATVAFGAMQWMPTLELARLSPRARLSYNDVSQGFAWAELVGLLRPNPGQWSPLFVGWIPLTLALAALPLRRKAEVLFWTIVAVLALLLSLGGNGFLYPLAHRFLPGLATFRSQERAAFLVSFALCVLAGYGYASLLRWRRWTRLALPLLLCLSFVDLYCASFGLVLQPAPSGGYFAGTPSVEALRGADGGVWRVSSEGLLPGDGNAGMVYQIRDVTGSTPLHLAQYDLFLDTVPELRWWQMLNVRYVLTRRELEHGALQLLVDEGDRRLYQIWLGAQPAWLVHSAQVAPDSEAALQLTADPTLDPLETVVLERVPVPSPQPALGPEEVRLVTYSAQRIVVEARLSAPGILVLSEVWYPGWTARLNGSTASSLRAFGLLRAIALPAGQCSVEWRYAPWTVYAGMAASFLAVAGLIVAVWNRRRRGRSSAGSRSWDKDEAE